MQSNRGVRPRLGAQLDSTGVTFSLRSQSAEDVWLCLFDDAAGEERIRLPLRRENGDLWSVRVEGLGEGALYGFRVDGPWDPAGGNRHNVHKLLTDPWARAVAGNTRWHSELLGHQLANPALPNLDDSVAVAPRSVVVADQAMAGRPARPAVSWGRTVIYECHLRGMTMLHPDVAPELRGTYQGFGTPAVIDHLLALGVTTVEFMPLAQGFDEENLVARGLTNYWGYAPLAFLAPNARFASTPMAATGELCQLVDRLHEAGIEVIVDVVLNHTCEGDERGPTLSLRGIDNAAYYRLQDGDRARYVDWSGCGNTLAADSPALMELGVGALRHWYEQIGVDGFRFDLSPILARVADGGFEPSRTLLGAITEDEVLKSAKLIAEPWDLAPKPIGRGGFGEVWAEWNDHFRDTAKRAWRGDHLLPGELARRLAGSPDLYSGKCTGPTASINYVGSHDGFTLSDWTSFQHKHNDANGEQNRDGSDNHMGRNWGVEGETDDPAILMVRQRVAAAMLATLFLSQGTPMLAHGDELGRTQQGNNNPYCQDGRLVWVDWTLHQAARARLSLVQRLIAFRRESGLFDRSDFLSGEPIAGTAAADVCWWHCDGRSMDVPDWENPDCRSLGVIYANPRGRWLLLFNRSEAICDFRLPEGSWCQLLDTAQVGGLAQAEQDAAALSPLDSKIDEPVRFGMGPQSVVVFQSQETKL